MLLIFLLTGRRRRTVFIALRNTHYILHDFCTQEPWYVARSLASLLYQSLQLFVFFVLFVELGVFFFWGTGTFLARLLLSLLLLNPTVVEAVVEAVVVVEEQDE